MASPDYATIDFFRDKDLFQDPHAYYEWMRAQGPVWHGPKRGVVFVSGYDEAVAVYRDHERFSSCNTVAGPFFPWPVPLEGDDISAIIDEHRDALPFSDQLPSFDPPQHTDQRGLLMRLITPKRLKENEEFMWRLADQTFDEFIDRGECEFVHDYALPFTLLVVADLLGVPEDDRDEFRDEAPAQGAAVDPEDGAQAARVPVRAVHQLHRGPPARAPRRRDDRPGHGDVPRRHAAAGRTTSCASPPTCSAPAARPRPGSCRRRSASSAIAPISSSAARRPDADPRLHGGGAAARAADQGRVPAVEGAGDGGRGRPARRAPACSC